MAKTAKTAATKVTKRQPAKSKAATGSQAKSKLDLIEEALRKPKGATITQLMGLTDWQMHSVRGALAGAMKKKRGLNITSTKLGKERVYRIGSAK